MPQLPLFNDQDAPFVSTSDRKRSVLKRRPKAVPTSQGDLWQQEADTEKEMVLFFLDIRNFTSITEKHQPAKVIYIIRKLFSRFENIIRLYHGRVIETAGDGFYAVFGLDRDIGEAVDTAVSAGNAILRELEKLNDESLERNFGHRIHVGIGVHVGRVAAGSLRLGARKHFVVMGYPVNIAARLQAATKELNNNFIISEDTFQKLNRPALRSETVRALLRGVKESVGLRLIGKAYAA